MSHFAKILWYAVSCSGVYLWMVMLAGCLSGTALAQEGHSLAEKSQNPIGNLITLPFQNTTNFNVGDLGKDQNVLLIEPVAPISLGPDRNLIVRPIVPLTYQPSLNAGDSYDFGLGDVQLQTYVTPKDVTPIPGGSFIAGAGPVFQFKSATDPRLGTGKWAVGVGGVVFVAIKPWTFGALVNNIWSFAGDSDRANVNLMTVQPFLNFNMERGWYLTSSPVMTFDWEANTNTIPLGVGFGRIFNIGEQPINAQIQAFGFAHKPTGGPDWSLRTQWTFLFPVD